MITTLEVVDIIWKYLSQSTLKTAIGGGIYKTRPMNSSKEDVIINSLPVNNRQLQAGIANVNIHVPNLVLQIDGMQDSSQPDDERLKYLTVLATSLMQKVWVISKHFNFTVQQQVVFQEEGKDEHYANIRIEYYSVNLKK